MRRIRFGCCAPAARGRAAAPPMSAMSSRRRMRGPRSVLRLCVCLIDQEIEAGEMGFCDQTPVAPQHVQRPARPHATQQQVS